MRRRHPLRSLVLLSTGAFSLASALGGPRTDTVAVRSHPAGATVLVDGDQAGVTPLELELSTAAEHVIHVAFDGVATQEWIVRPTLPWGVWGTALCGGGLSFVPTLLEAATGGGRELRPDEIDARPLAPPVP